MVSGYAEIVAYMLETYAEQMTPAISDVALREAVAHEGVVRLLLDYHVPEEPLLSDVWVNALARGHYNVADMLFARAVRTVRHEVLATAVRYCDVNMVTRLMDWMGRTSLAAYDHVASCRIMCAAVGTNSVVMLALLLDRVGKMLLARGERAVTIGMLMSAVNVCRSMSLLSLLLDYVEDHESVLDEQTYYGWTVLGSAIWNHDLDIAELLLRKGADVNKPERLNDKTALHWAVKTCSPEATKLLLERGARVDVRSGRGKTPLNYAIHKIITRIRKEGYPGNNDAWCRIISWLVEHGADINEPFNGVTPLHELFEVADWDCVTAVAELMMKLGADVRSVRTPSVYRNMRQWRLLYDAGMLMLDS